MHPNWTSSQKAAGHGAAHDMRSAELLYCSAHAVARSWPSPALTGGGTSERQEMGRDGESWKYVG